MIHPTAIIHAGAKLGSGVSVGAYSIIGEHVEIGDNTWIGPHVVISGHTRIGCDNRIFQFNSIGEVPQDKKYAGEPTRLEIGDRNGGAPVLPYRCAYHDRRGNRRPSGCSPLCHGGRKLSLALRNQRRGIEA